MPRVSFYTLGCKLNYAETTTLQRNFEERDYEVVPFGEASDVLVVNTCTVTSEAERKARQTIRRAIREQPEAYVIVTGCYAQMRPDDLAAIDGVDAVLGAQEKFQLFERIEALDGGASSNNGAVATTTGTSAAFAKEEATQVSVSCIDEANTFGPAFSTGERTRAFLKVQDGCDYSCSFCTIPMARGASRSQPVTATLQQARRLAEEGYKEVVLSGVNIGLYGDDRDGDASLLDLLMALDDVDGLERLRISSIEPNLLTDDIIHFVAESPRFQPHFHIPLQSGDDDVLGRMRRRYVRQDYADRVHLIRRLMPDAAIGVDVIVGFPAEDDAKFENTYRFVNELPVSYLHVFTYSERPGTVAVDAPEKVGGRAPDGNVRSERNRRLRMLSQKKSRAHAAAHIGTERPVLWESPQQSGRMYGYTDNYIRLEREADPARENLIEHVRLAALTERDTVAAGAPAPVAA